MQAVVENSITFAGTAADITLLGGAGTLIISIANLIAELKGSKEICEELLVSVEKLQPPLKRMIQHGNIGANRAVKAYDVLLTDMESFLTDHVAKKTALRFVNHWKVKDKIKLFYAKRDQIVDLMRLEFLEETTIRHASVTNRLDDILDREQHIEEQCKKEFEAMKDTVQLELKALNSELAHRADNSADGFAEKMVVALSDIKFELKYNKTRTDEERRELKQVFDLAKRATKLETPHLSAWYISGADIQYEAASLAAGQSGSSVHIGKLSFGAKVLVKVSNAAADDTENRKRFTDEVEKWYPLRHPHVLPLYGASEFTTPQLFVLAYAEKGNFNQFLRKHPHLFWKVFLDAARGLVYLHSRKTPLVHGNLKCSNLLVMADGTGVVSDFAFAFLRADSNLSGKVQSPSTGWKAPECLRIGSGGNARIQSDVYSLGMCVYEGLMGCAPFDGLDEDEIIANIRAGKLPERASPRVNDEAWSLITKMCALDFHDRITMSKVIRLMEALASREEAVRESLQCACTPGRCSDCGKPLQRPDAKISDWRLAPLGA